MSNQTSTTDAVEARASTPAMEPIAISIAEASRLSGMSRSEIYRRLGADQIQAVKSGVRTLILMDSLRRHLASLPPATFSNQLHEP